MHVIFSHSLTLFLHSLHLMSPLFCVVLFLLFLFCSFFILFLLLVCANIIRLNAQRWTFQMCHPNCCTKTSSTFYNSIGLFIASTYYAVWKWYIFVCTSIIIECMQTFGTLSIGLCIFISGEKAVKVLSYVQRPNQIMPPNCSVCWTQSKHLDDEYRIQIQKKKKRKMNGRWIYRANNITMFIFVCTVLKSEGNKKRTNCHGA